MLDREAGQTGRVGEVAVFSLTLVGYLSLAGLSELGFLYDSSSFEPKTKPAQPQPPGEKKVLSSFGHLDPHSILWGRWPSQ